MTLQEQIRQYRRQWTERGKWQDPDLADSLDFLLTEIFEVEEASETFSGIFLALECFDVVMMACVTADLLGHTITTEGVALYHYDASHTTVINDLKKSCNRAIRTRLRLHSGYTRNNQKEASTTDIKRELNEIVYMAGYLCNRIGFPLETVAQNKLEQMDLKRQ